MYKRETVIRNETGLHARPASEFVSAANKFQSAITIRRVDGDEQKPVNAKSIVFLLTLGAGKGCPVEIEAAGEDARAAVDGLVELIESGFGE